MENFINMYNKRGFSLFEILLVLLFIGIITTLVIPFTISFIDRQKERKKVLDIITEIGNLKKKSVSNLQLGKISLENGSLVFYLDNQIINKVNFVNTINMEHEITFNRNGVSSGGEIQLQFSKKYIIVIKQISGIIKLEIGNER